MVGCSRRRSGPLRSIRAEAIWVGLTESVTVRPSTVPLSSSIVPDGTAFPTAGRAPSRAQQTGYDGPPPSIRELSGSHHTIHDRDFTL